VVKQQQSCGELFQRVDFSENINLKMMGITDILFRKFL